MKHILTVVMLVIASAAMACDTDPPADPPPDSDQCWNGRC